MALHFGGGGDSTPADGSVTLAKLADLAANSIIGNDTGSATTPQALTAAEARTLLGLGFQQIGSSLTTTGAGPWDFTSVPATYTDLRLVAEGTISGTSVKVQFSVSNDNGSTWSSANDFGSTGYTNAAFEAVGEFYAYNDDAGVGLVGRPGTGSPLNVNLSNTNLSGYAIWAAPGGIDAVRFALSTGTASPITVSLFGRY